MDLREVLSKPRSVVNLAVIGSLVLCIVGSFTYVRVALAGVDPSASLFSASEPMFFAADTTCSEVKPKCSATISCEDLVVRRSQPYGYETGDQPALS